MCDGILCVNFELTLYLVAKHCRNVSGIAHYNLCQCHINEFSNNE